MDRMETLEAALTTTSCRSRSRSRSRGADKQKVADLEHKVAVLESHLAQLGATVASEKIKVEALMCDRAFWLRFRDGLWRVFNGPTIESLSRTQGQEDLQFLVRFHSVTAHTYCSQRAHPFAVVLLPGHAVMLPGPSAPRRAAQRRHSVGGSEPEETRTSADEVSHTISVSTSALLAF